MSSAKGKASNNKQKPQEQLALQQHNEELVKTNLQQSITIKKLNQQLVCMKQLQLHQLSEYQQSNNQRAQSMQKLQLMRLTQQQHLKKLREKKQKLQIQNGQLSYKLQRLSKEYEQYKQLMKQELDDMKRIYDSEIKTYQAVTQDYQQAIHQRKSYLQMNQQLNIQLNSLTENYKMVIADKDREKLQTVDFMKKDMLDKAKQLKTTLLTMKREQMSTNTRLTVLQNQQLLEQLQYQSKNTQKILQKNHLLEQELNDVKKELQIEKQVNDQLAKRTTIAKKIIKTIQENDKQSLIVSTENHQQSPKKKSYNNQAKDNRANSKSKSMINSNNNNSSNDNTKQVLNQYQKAITMLQTQLENKNQQVQIKAKQVKKYLKLYEEIKPKYQAYLNTQGNLKVIMVRFLKSILEGKDIGDQVQMEYDIRRLKNIPVDQWTKSDIQLTVRMLLTFLRPNFTMKYMKAQYFKHTRKSLDMDDDASEIEDLLKMPKINTQYGNLTTKYNTTNSFKNRFDKGKTMSTFGEYLKIEDKNNVNSRHSYDKKEQHSAHVSRYVSPVNKQFSLNQILREIKKQKLLKPQSQSLCNLSQLTTAANKFISGQESTVEYSDIKNLQNPQCQVINIENFKSKQTKKLIKSHYRQWGHKINLKLRGSFISVKKP